MLNKIIFCGFAWYLSAALISEQAWGVSHTMEFMCLLTTAVIVCFPTAINSEHVPTEFSTQKYYFF